MTGRLLAAPTGWELHRTAGPAGPFHHLRPAPVAPQLWVHQVDRPALVLGSTQCDDLVDRDAAARFGVEVARRRSGGGLVLVHPDHARWVDVIVPRGHRRWDDDVRRASYWLGSAWAAAVTAGLVDQGQDPARVRWHEGPMVSTEWSSILCFAGLGPGEVTVEGAKVVGISQRRTRDWVRFQCLVLAEADLELLSRLLDPSQLPGPAKALLELPIGPPVPGGLDLDAVLHQFVSRMG